VNSPTKCQIPLHGPDRTRSDPTRQSPRTCRRPARTQRTLSETPVGDPGLRQSLVGAVEWNLVDYSKLAGVRGGSAMHWNDARLIFRTFCYWQPCSELVARRRRALKAYSQHTSWTKLQFENSSVNSLMGKHVLRINRALTVLVSLQPITAKYSRDADARDQSARVV